MSMDDVGVALLIERPDRRLYELGRWFAHDRSEALRQAAAWLQMNHRPTMVPYGTTPFAYVTRYDVPYEQWPEKAQQERLNGNQEMDTRRAQAQQDGSAMAHALSVVLSGNVRSKDYQAAVFSLGRWFAAMSAYTDVDAAFSYIEGFVGAFAVQPATMGAISAPVATTPGDNSPAG